MIVFCYISLSAFANIPISALGKASHMPTM